MLKKEFENYNTFIFDLDGTLLLEDEVFSNAIYTLNLLADLGKHLLFISNNTTKNVIHYSGLFNQSGIIVNEDQFIVAADVLVEGLKQQELKNFFLIGEDALKYKLENSGLMYSENTANAEIVIVSLDREYSTEKFLFAKNSLLNGAKLYAANIDNSCPTKHGEIIDAGEIIELLVSQTGVKLQKHFGKPSIDFFNHLKAKLPTPKHECLIIGDRLETDIKLGNNNGIDTALVSTGVKYNSAYNGFIKPTFKIETIADLFKFSGR